MQARMLKARKPKQRPTEEARAAHSAVRAALRAGTLRRPTACEQCGASDHRIEAAHHDYQRPLDLRWLCTSCHRAWDWANPKGGTIESLCRDGRGVTLEKTPAKAGVGACG